MRTTIEVELVDFATFKQVIQRRFNEIKGLPLFQVHIDKDELWALYLASFPEGTNSKFRERSDHDCSACRAFIKNAGGMAAVVDGELITLWDVQVGGQYQAVVDALASYVKSRPIDNVFLHPDSRIGTDKNHEDINGQVVTWEHLHAVLPTALYCAKAEIGPRQGEFRALHDVVLRSLEEITTDALETVRDLVAQNSLYRGAEKKGLLDAFAQMKAQFDELPAGGARDLYAWSQVQGLNAWVCRIRNDVIGTLLVDLSEGKDLEQAVKAFEDKVSGTNYKRPTSLVTPKMRDAARQTLQDLGLMDALERRYARLEDVSVANVLFADRNAKKRMAGDVFDDVPTKAQAQKNFDKIEEVPIDKFIADILPSAKSLELLVENRHAGNLVSLIAPHDLTAKSLFKWSNPFSWSYSGDVADSIKERVKRAGGNVTGEVCCRLAWFNHDDLDFHMIEPNREEIYYGNKMSSQSYGQLDVDMNVSNLVRDAVENIFYERISDMPQGIYSLGVHQFNRRETVDVGFDVEIDVLGTVYKFSYQESVPQGRMIQVAALSVTKSGVEVAASLPAVQAVREIWNLKTQSFHPVTALMLSPNFWDGKGVGNKHFFFMLDGCRNDGSARGFYNEFLSSEMEPHRRTMEIVGSKMRAEHCDDQMSGLGFSSTQRNSAICRVGGSFTRTVKIVF